MSSPVPIPMILSCPNCHKVHSDEGEWKTRPHKTHRCVNDTFGKGCGAEWRPANVPTVGVLLLASDAPRGKDLSVGETRVSPTEAKAWGLEFMWGSWLAAYTAFEDQPLTKALRRCGRLAPGFKLTMRALTPQESLEGAGQAMWVAKVGGRAYGETVNLASPARRALYPKRYLTTLLEDVLEFVAGAEHVLREVARQDKERGDVMGTPIVGTKQQISAIQRVCKAAVVWGHNRKYLWNDTATGIGDDSRALIHAVRDLEVQGDKAESDKPLKQVAKEVYEAEASKLAAVDSIRVLAIQRAAWEEMLAAIPGCWSGVVDPMRMWLDVRQGSAGRTAAIFVSLETSKLLDEERRLRPLAEAEAKANDAKLEALRKIKAEEQAALDLWASCSPDSRASAATVHATRAAETARLSKEYAEASSAARDKWICARRKAIEALHRELFPGVGT